MTPITKLLKQLKKQTLDLLKEHVQERKELTLKKKNLNLNGKNKLFKSAELQRL